MRPHASRLIVPIIIASFLAPSLSMGASGGATPATWDQVVEGHVVYATLAFTPDEGDLTNLTDFRVSEGSGAGGDERFVQRFPGVLWFNDQFVLSPNFALNVRQSESDATFTTNRFGAAVAVQVTRETAVGSTMPCGGAVFVTNQGDPSPIGDQGEFPESAWRYVTSFLITDPNDRSWLIDEYLLLGAFPVWVVNLLGSAVFTPDVGTDCDPATPLVPGAEDAVRGLDLPLTPSVPVVMTATVDAPPAGATEPDGSGFCYAGPPANGGSCGGIAPRVYNALLYLPWAALAVPGAPRDHQSASSTDTNGCAFGTAFACPAHDDDAEGRSHGFAPAGAPHEFQPCPPGFTGTAQNHGGSQAIEPRCDGLHATRNVDIYYRADARPGAPANRNFAVVDMQGSDAGFSAWSPN